MCVCVCVCACVCTQTSTTVAFIIPGVKNAEVSLLVCAMYSVPITFSCCSPGVHLH